MTKQTTNGAVGIARRVALAIKAGDWAGALAAIDDGARDYPDATLPKGATWETLRVVVVGRMPAPAPESAPEVTAAPEPQSAPEQETGLPALTIVHTIEGGTLLLGAPKGEIGKRVSAVMGKNGQRWMFSYRLPTGAGWYIMGSRPGGADMPRITAARKALQAAGFPVSLDITTTDADGNVVPPKLSGAETARRARARASAVNALHWHLTATEQGLPCSESACDATDLRPRTASIIDDPETGTPRVVCRTHDTGATVIVPMPDHVPVAPVLPDMDDQADHEPQVAPVRAAKPARAAAPAKDGWSVDMDRLIALVMAGDSDTAVDLGRRMLGTPAPAPKARTRRPASAPVSAVPAQVAVPDFGPLTVKVGLSDDAKAKATASDVRRELYAKVTHVNRKYGVEIHVFLSPYVRTLTITVTMANASPEVRARIARKVESVALAVRGAQSLINA